MKLSILLPSWTKYIGFLCLAVGIAFGVGILTDWWDYSMLSDTLVNDICLILMIVGAILIISSRLKHEDEYTELLRFHSLLMSLYANTVIAIIGICLFNSLDFILFMAIDLVLIPLVFLVLFVYEYLQYLKLGDDDEK